MPQAAHKNFSLLQAVDIFDQPFDLVVGQFAFKLRHLAFALFGDFGHVGV
jgi:hypothetical protein